MNGDDQQDDTSDHDPKAPYVPKGGEDESGASQDGDDDHVREDQKPTTK